MIHYDQLIRDTLPEIIEASGKTCEIDILSNEDYLRYLNKKLLEEANEYDESHNVEELADLEEVLRAILRVKGVSYEEFETIRQLKAEKRGAFEKRLLLKSVE